MATALASSRLTAFFKGAAHRASPAGGLTEAARRVTVELRQHAARPAPDVWAATSSAPEGLTEAVARDRLAAAGRNAIARERPVSWAHRFARAFQNSFVVLLLVLATVSAAMNDVPATIIISVMVLVSVVLRVVQEQRASVAADRLKALVRVTATALRRGEQGDPPRRREVPTEELVPGDVVLLAAGDMIPADVRLLASKDLFVSQAALTGEALPVEKASAPVPGATSTAVELPNIGLMGTNVVSGTATAVVVATGERTYLGSLASTIVGQRTVTSFEKGVDGISLLLLRFMGVMTVLVFVINGVGKGSWSQAFLFALSVAVGLTPEMLPMIVTGTLAIGAVSMSRKKVIVKRLNAIQNLGAMNVLCTDKTGTLTLDRVVLERYCDVGGEESETVLRYAYVNSFFQTGLKNLLDVAILGHRELTLVGYDKVDELPFDFSRRIMSVVVDHDGHRELVAKGAPEEILRRCNRFAVEEETLDIEELFLPDLMEQVRLLSSDGYRVLAVARKSVETDRSAFTRQDERDLILVGYVAFLDPPAETAGQAIATLRHHGVTVKILTGDNELVTRKICKDVGLPVDHVVLGAELDEKSDDELGALAEVTSVFARLTPAHKERVIRVLQARGSVVGFLGDGINDAPALRAADVGISVENAVDIAKESADVILLEKNLLVLEDGVLEGRKVFGNIMKYLKMGTSSNFGNMFSVLGASAFLPFLPMLPLQLLCQNLLYDLSQLAIPFDRVDASYVVRPRQWKTTEIARFMVFMGPVSSIFDYATFAVMYFVFAARTPEHQALFQSGWFVEGLLSQTLIVHMIRTPKVPFLQSTAALPLLLTTAGIVAVGIYLPFSPLGPMLGMEALPARYFGWLAAILAAYVVLTHGVKTWFVRRYGYN